jgi:Acetyltransferase (GNAT) family
VIETVNLQAIVDAPEFASLIVEYADESAMAGMPSPILQFDKYEAYEQVGALHIVRAVEEGELIGFLAMLANPLNAHYGVPLAVVESFFVTRERRGTAGLGLIAAAEELARQLGSPKLFFSAPVGSRIQALLPKMGYSVTNVVYAKDV